MAINDPNYRYATQTWEADGVRTQYDIAFDGGYIRQSDVVAYSIIPNPVPDPSTGDVDFDRTPLTLTFISETVDPDTGVKTATVQITPAVTNGLRVVIYRSTEKGMPLVTYQNGSILTEANLDLANDQAVFGIAEIMDGLNEAGLSINTTVQQVIDTNALVQELYNEVLSLLSEGGIIGVTPLKWDIVGDGVSTDFDLVGADLFDATFFDVYLDGLAQEPIDGFVILAGTGDTPPIIRFPTAPDDGVDGFVVLRGNAKAYSGPAPVTSLRAKITTISTAHFVDQADEFAFLRSTSGSEVDVTIKKIVTGVDPLTVMGKGSYFSICQRGAGQVVVTGATDVTIIIPTGYVAKTRAQNSTISFTCEDDGTNTWVASGDLAKAT